jgi:Uma2 family endonuclease
MAADIGLVIEISAATLAEDRTDMGRVYATGGIPYYWIVNLIDTQVEVYTDPDPAAGRYGNRVDFLPGQDVPVIIDGQEVGRIAVLDLLLGL